MFRVRFKLSGLLYAVCLLLIDSDVNKDWTHKDQDKDKDQSHKDKDKD